MPSSVTPDEAPQGAERRREVQYACMQAAAIGAAQPGITMLTYDVRGVNKGGVCGGRGTGQSLNSRHADLRE